MDSLKQKTISGLTWSFIENFANQGIQFIVGIILARLLTPDEFGLIGMIAIFIAVSQSFIDSGFSSALIRKKECNDNDYPTVFFYNLAAGITLYLILFFLATPISNFYNQPILKSLIRVLGLSLIIRSFTIIQFVILTKRLDFKLHAKISVLATLISGVIGIVMAYKGFGVWSLVIRTVTTAFFTSLFLWIWNRWKPPFVFSISSFKELFGFGSKLLLSGLIDTIYNNIYYLIIGKFFSAKELGYYTRADTIKDIPSKNINGVVSKVTYPVLSSLQDDKIALKAAYRRIIKSVMLITFVLMIGLAAIAEPMIVTLIGDKWLPCVIYLQMLCFSGMLYPLHALNLNMLKVEGRSDLFLKLEIIKKIIAVPVILTGILWGIKAMIGGMIVLSLIAYYLNSYWSGKFINYSTKDQILDITPSFLIAIFMGIIVYLTGMILNFGSLPKFLIQLAIGSLIVFSICELIKFSDYIYLKEIVKTKVSDYFYARTRK